ncbi:MAG: GNAT family N-acetyltransferase [Deltaproteobacteria bacterium]|nr:GNAT family N-acetyltransferase [Deltaproteobacteria bacterium]
MIKLQAHLWGRDQATRAAYLEWKYDQNPYTDDTYIYLAFYNKQLVGMVGAYGVKWQIGDIGQTFPGLCFADLVIHPRHRNRNLFPKLMTYALNDLSNTSYAYAFDLSAAPHVAFILLMQGWRSMFIQTAYRTTDHATQSGQLMENEQKLPRFTVVYRQFCGHLDKLPMLASICHWLRRYTYDLVLQRATQPRRVFVDLDDSAVRHKINPCVTLSKTARPKAMAELAKRIGFDGRIRHVRDEQYFSWRFQNPLSEYRFLFWGNGRLDGYFVLHMKVYPPGNDELAYIVDWDAKNGHVWHDLLQAAIQWGNFNNISIWSSALSEDVKTHLRKAGFTFKDKTGSATRDVRGENILVKSINQNIQQSNWILGGRDLLDSTNWDLRTIYSDDF